MFSVTASRLLLDKLFFIVCISSLQFKETIQQKKKRYLCFSSENDQPACFCGAAGEVEASHWAAAVECRVIYCDALTVRLDLLYPSEYWNIEYLRGEKTKQIFSPPQYFSNLCSSHVHVHTITHRAAVAKFNSQQVTMEFSGRQGNVVGEIKSTLESQNEVCLRVSVCVCACVFLSLHHCSATSNK